VKVPGKLAQAIAEHLLGHMAGRSKIEFGGGVIIEKIGSNPGR
jgi:hypothetical protein